MINKTCRLFIAFIILCGLSEGLNAQEARREGAPLRKAVLVLPLQARPGLSLAQKHLGLGAQGVLENVLVLHSDLDETFAAWSYATLFPQSKDLKTWMQDWMEGKANLPEGIEKLGMRYVVTGKIDKREQGLTAELELLDRASHMRVKKTVQLDLPSLIRFREGFLELLAQAEIPSPPAQKAKMLWAEALSAEALNLLGQQSLELATIAPYQDESSTYDPRPFEEGMRIAPRSYMTATGLGVLHFSREKYAESQKLFERALELNPYGKSAASALMAIAIKRDDEKSARDCATRVEEITGRSAKPALLNLYAQQALKAEDEQQWEKAVKYREQVLKLCRETNNRAGEINTIIYLSMLYSGLQRHEKVIEYLEQLLPFIDRLPPATAGTALRRLGDGYRNTGKYDQAIEAYQKSLVILQKLDDKSDLAMALDGIGLSYAELDQRDKAIDYTEQALTVWHNGKGMSPGFQANGKWLTLFRLGGLYARWAQYNQALDRFQQALVNARQQKNEGHEAGALSQLGSTYQKMERFENAIDYYLLSIPIYRKLQDRRREAIYLIGIGSCYDHLSLFDKALDYHEQAFRIYQEAGDKSEQATALKMIGSVYISLSEYEKAVEYFERALMINRDVNDSGIQYSTLSNLGLAYQKLSQYEKAVEYNEQALKIARATRNRKGEATTLNNLGIAYNGLSLFDKSKEAQEQSLKITRELGERGSEARSIGNMGAVYGTLGDYERAIENYQKALIAAREVKNRLLESALLNNIGSTYRIITKFSEALHYLQQAVIISHEIKDRSGEAISLGNIGLIYSNLGQYEKAIDYYRQMLAIMRQVKSRDYEAGALSSLGSAYFRLGLYSQAQAYAEQSLQIYREIKSRASEGEQYADLGRIQNAMGNYDRAMDYLNRSLVIARDLKIRAGIGWTYFLIGQVHVNLKNYDQAIAHFEQAVLIYRDLKNGANESEALKHLMKSWQALNQPALAIFFGKQAISIYQAIRQNIQALEKESQQSFLKSKEDTYRELADRLLAQGRLPEAEQVLNLLKEEEYSQIIRRGAGIGGLGYTKLENEAAKIDASLAALAKDRGGLLARVEQKLATEEDRERLNLIDGRIKAANEEIRRLLAVVYKAAPTEKERTDSSQSIMTTLRGLGAGVVALYAIVTKEKVWIMLVTPDFRKAYSVNTSGLEKTVMDFRELLKTDKNDPLPLAKKLYQILLQGPKSDLDGATLAADLKAYGAKTLMWSLDGVLRFVPIAALHDGEKYLVESYRNIVFTTASLSRLPLTATPRWKALGLGVSKPYEAFPALPAVPRELSAIIREAGKPKAAGVLPGTIKLDEQFTEKTLIDGLREGFEVVHIASHYSFNAADPGTSFLLMGNGEHLSLSRIQDFPSNFEKVELLTLSACDTATESMANGKEVEGLAYVTQLLGAKAVVASLWPIADEGTEVLMRDFYKIKSASPTLLKAEAFRRAQLTLLLGRVPDAATNPGRRGAKVRAAAPFIVNPKARFAHPHYWSPFILIGNFK